MKVNGNTIKPGNVIEHKSGLWIAVKTSHVKPGKGGAFAQIELRNLKDGTKLNERFRSSENIERIILEESSFIFLYKESYFFDQWCKLPTGVHVQYPYLKDKLKFLRRNFSN